MAAVDGGALAAVIEGDAQGAGILHPDGIGVVAGAEAWPGDLVKLEVGALAGDLAHALHPELVALGVEGEPGQQHQLPTQMLDGEALAALGRVVPGAGDAGVDRRVQVAGNEQRQQGEKSADGHQYFPWARSVDQPMKWRRIVQLNFWFELQRFVNSFLPGSPCQASWPGRTGQEAVSLR
ncbi:MAG: hypothetical protein M0Q42_05705 [Xanthomonadales bacterium]|nr:hypothetical protein [Xanthomonadales bacterium]